MTRLAALAIALVIPAAVSSPPAPAAPGPSCSATLTGAVSGTTPCVLQLVNTSGMTVLSITTQPFGGGTPAASQLILQAGVEMAGNTSIGSWTDATVTQSAVSVIRTDNGVAWVETTGQPRQGTMSLTLTRLGTPQVIGPVSRWPDASGTLRANLVGPSGQVAVTITLGGTPTTATAATSSPATAAPRTLFKPTLAQFAVHPALQAGMTMTAFLNAVQPQIGPGEKPPAPRKGGVMLAPTVKPCAGGGQIKISATVPALANSGTGAVTITFTAQYLNCASDSTTMDGSVTMTYAVSTDDGSGGGGGGAGGSGTSSGHATTTVDGGPVTMTIGSSAPTSVTFHHLTSSVGFLASMSGTSVRCATVIAAPPTGSMTFGTSTYTPTAAEASAVLGTSSGMPKC